MTDEYSKPGFPTITVREGDVEVLVPKLDAFAKMPSDYAPSKAPVFYNPVMELNRDLAVLALQAYQRTITREISVCEPFTGCGLRGIRFAMEVEGVAKVVMNDISEKAFQLADLNVQSNGLAGKTRVKHDEANLLLSRHSSPHRRFDAIDIDPFGSPVRFLDSALRALRDGGLLALTATDMAPLCGVHPRACIRKYGGKPLRTEYCHELAVRLLAGCLATIAARHDIGVDIVFSHGAEHYIRTYATIRYGAKKADESINNVGYLVHCFKCFHRQAERNIVTAERSDRCRECGSELSIGGPLWLGRLLDARFVELIENEANLRSLGSVKRIRRMLKLIKTEVEAPITYYVIDKLCDSMNLPVPSVKKVVEALTNEGYQTSLTHFNTRGIKSNASASEMRKILFDLAKESSTRTEASS
jgi:tRNA (guanine26-N2/guanine27-N2)-dimethyltransferase